GGGLFCICLIYALIDVFSLAWWLIVIISVAFVTIIFSASIFTAGSKTEDIALNNHTEYKDYKTRYAEKEEQDKKEEQNQGEMPTIKSFKD
ncbi:MAG: hypothetical protein J6V68_03330, partial [Clostridia bacterium]|nr:hypothetical protein [Clostridia bacterium]